MYICFQQTCSCITYFTTENLIVTRVFKVIVIYTDILIRVLEKSPQLFVAVKADSYEKREQAIHVDVKENIKTKLYTQEKRKRIKKRYF